VTPDILSTAAIGKILNEVVLGFLPKLSLDLLNTYPEIDSINTRTEAKDVINFTNIGYKRHYDRNYTPIFIRVGDYVVLRLYKGYNIPS